MEILNTPPIMHLTNVLKDLTRNILVNLNELLKYSHILCDLHQIFNDH